MTPERGALIPQFRQKAQLVTCLPNNPSLGLSFATIAFVLSHQPLRLGMGEVSGPPPSTLFRGHVTSRPHGNHATCHSC